MVESLSSASWLSGGRSAGTPTRRDPTGAEARIKGVPAEKTRSFRAFQLCEFPCFLAPLRQCRQSVQRLLKTTHRYDAQSMRVLACIRRILSRRDEEGIHTRLARSDRLLLDPADRAHPAVEEDLSGRRDLVAAVDVPSELLK